MEKLVIHSPNADNLQIEIKPVGALKEEQMYEDAEALYVFLSNNLPIGTLAHLERICQKEREKLGIH